MDKQRRIERVREALANGRVSAVEFYKDGSGASFEYLDPVGDPEEHPGICIRYKHERI